MYNQKGTVYLPQKQHSPNPQKQPSSSKYKLYTPEEVSRVIKNFLEPKLHHLQKQIANKQQIINSLNQKLDDNDLLLQKQIRSTEAIIKQDKQAVNTQRITHFVAQKFQQFGGQIKMKIDQMRETHQKNMYRRQEELFDAEIGRLRKEIKHFVEESKIKNNNYWLKIKEVINKIHQKVINNDNTLTKIEAMILEEKRNHDNNHNMVLQLQDSKRTIKTLIQLKQSVNNIMSSYDQVLQLQKVFRKNIESIEDDTQKEHLQNWSKNQSIDFGITVENPTVESPTDFMLEYSYDDSRAPVNDRNTPMQGKPKQKDQASNNDSRRNIPMSPKLSQTYEQYFKVAQKGSSRTKAPQHSDFFEGLRNSDPRKVINNSNSNHNNSHSVSLINFSLQMRKELTQDIRQRIQQLIQVKCYCKPLIIQLDQVNNMKDEEGHYLFDLNNNMLKISQKQLATLEKEGILKQRQKMGVKTEDSNNRKDKHS